MEEGDHDVRPILGRSFARDDHADGALFAADGAREKFGAVDRLLNEDDELLTKVFVGGLVEESGESAEQLFLGFGAVELACGAIDIEHAHTPDALFEIGASGGKPLAQRSRGWGAARISGWLVGGGNPLPPRAPRIP